MKKLLLLLMMFSGLVGAQMPDISEVWLNKSRPYNGTIGKDGQKMILRIEISDQDKKNDQEYFVSGYSMADSNHAKLEGKLKITQYRDFKKRGVVYGDYEFWEENKDKHAGNFTGRFIYTFQWNKKTEKIENQYIEFIGNWKSYDGTLNFKTRFKNQLE